MSNPHARVWQNIWLIIEVIIITYYYSNIFVVISLLLYNSFFRQFSWWLMFYIIITNNDRNKNPLERKNKKKLACNCYYQMHMIMDSSINNFFIMTWVIFYRMRFNLNKLSFQDFYIYLSNKIKTTNQDCVYNASLADLFVFQINAILNMKPTVYLVQSYAVWSARCLKLLFSLKWALWKFCFIPSLCDMRKSRIVSVY